MTSRPAVLQRAVATFAYAPQLLWKLRKQVIVALKRVQAIGVNCRVAGVHVKPNSRERILFNQTVMSMPPGLGHT